MNDVLLLIGECPKGDGEFKRLCKGCKQKKPLEKSRGFRLKSATIPLHGTSLRSASFSHKLLKIKRVQLLAEPFNLKSATTYSPTIAVPSALSGLTSLFGMGRGGTPML